MELLIHVSHIIICLITFLCSYFYPRFYFNHLNPIYLSLYHLVSFICCLNAFFMFHVKQFTLNRPVETCFPCLCTLWFNSTKDIILASREALRNVCITKMPICPSTTTVEMPLTPSCLAGAAQQPAVVGCGCVEQLPGVNVCKSITVRHAGKMKLSMHALRIKVKKFFNIDN